MSLLSRKRILAAAIESTIGTAETLDATDGTINVVGTPQIQATIPVEKREAQGNLGFLSGIPGSRTGVATFRTMLEYDGTNVPQWALTLLPACGYVQSTNTFNPTSEPPGTNVKTLTIGTYVAGSGDAVLKKITGAVGNFVVTLPTGLPGYIDWTFTGVWQPPVDATIIDPTYETDQTLRFAGGLAEWNDVNMCVSQASIDAGNVIHMRECPTTDAGLIAGIITERHPKVTVDPEAVLIATQDRWQEWLDQTEYALELDCKGPTGLVSDAALSFDAPKAQIYNAQEGERGKLLTTSLEFMCNKNGATADEDLQIVFTPKADA